VTAADAFAIIPPRAPALPVLAHVPHGGTTIPEDVRAAITLDDAELARELVRMTDWHTAALFGWAAEAGATMFVNHVSRLVVDPERFADDAEEPMAAVGQAAVYLRTSHGSPLRVPDAADRERLMARFYAPYHHALSALVDAVVDAHGTCTILDCHSFATVPLPSERDQRPGRPDICIGTDPFHSPSDVVAALMAAFADEGLRVALDEPFTGALVPLDRYRRDRRVRAVMIEVRRGLYCDESTGRPLPSLTATRDAIARAVHAAGVLRIPSG
jgi:N-formylglutamate deformylase